MRCPALVGGIPGRLHKRVLVNMHPNHKCFLRCLLICRMAVYRVQTTRTPPVTLCFLPVSPETCGILVFRRDPSSQVPHQPMLLACVSFDLPESYHQPPALRSPGENLPGTASQCQWHRGMFGGLDRRDRNTPPAPIRHKDPSKVRVPAARRSAEGPGRERVKRF